MDTLDLGLRLPDEKLLKVCAALSTLPGIRKYMVWKMSCYHWLLYYSTVVRLLSWENPSLGAYLIRYILHSWPWCAYSLINDTRVVAASANFSTVDSCWQGLLSNALSTNTKWIYSSAQELICYFCFGEQIDFAHKMGLYVQLWNHHCGILLENWAKLAKHQCWRWV